MILTKEVAKGIMNLNPSGLVDQAIADRQFDVIVEAFNHLQNGNSYIYIADEVGLGKTYIALGITSLLRHFSETPNSFTDLIIVPKKNLQFKWQKEIKRFVSYNYLLEDNRVKSVIGIPVGLSGKDQIYEKFRLIYNNKAAYNTYRISSFSMGTHESFDWEQEFMSFPEGPDIFPKVKHPADDSLLRRLYAILMNINSPQMDCVIVDEIHNFKHGCYGQVSQRNEVMSRFMGNVMLQDQDIFNLFPELEARIKPLAKKIIFLSATPIDKGMYQLKNQLDVFLPQHKYRNIDIEVQNNSMEAELPNFLIRGVMNIKLKDKDYSRNMYRYEHRNGNVALKEMAEPLRLTDEKMALITGLVQYKTMKELSAKNNPSFEIGLLAGFESYKPKPKSQDQEFEKSGQNEQKEAADANVIQQLAESYYKEFGKSMPHLKQDALVVELFRLMKKGEKALVFTRRIASVVELEAKLSEAYSDFIYEKIESFERKNKSARLQILTKAFKEQSQRKDIEDILNLVSSRLSISKLNGLFEPPKEYKEQKEIQQLLTRLYDEPSEDNYWKDHKSDLEKYQELIHKHIGRKNRVDSELVDLCIILLQSSLDRLLDDNDPDSTLENEDQDLSEVITTPYFFEGFFKGRGKTFRKASYDNPWYELNIHLLNREYQLFNIDKVKLDKYKQPEGNKKEAYLFRGEQDNYEAVMMDNSTYLAYDIQKERLLQSTFITSLLLGTCRTEFDEWMSNQKGKRKDHIIENINSLVEILKGIFRSGSGIIPAYLAWTTNDFKPQLISLLETDFQFVLKEVKTVIIDFERIVSSNFPESSKIKYALYNQLPIQGVSGFHKANVSKIAAQFRMPGYPYILVATDILKEGEDLHTYCSHVYHYGIAWNPSDMEQRTGRIDRIGSKCYYQLKAKQEETIPFDRKLQVFFPYLSDTLEVNQVVKVFNGMNQFVDTFYDFTKAKTGDNRSGTNEVVKRIPEQITTKLESKYDIKHFVKATDGDTYLMPFPVLGKRKENLMNKLASFNQYIIEKHVDRQDEYSVVDIVSLHIKGLIYQEEKNRQCPFKIYVVNGEHAGTFQYEIISPITNRRNLTRGALKDIREILPGERLFELNSILFARDYAPMDAKHEDILATLERLVFTADEMEEKYAKEDFNYWEN